MQMPRPKSGKVDSDCYHRSLAGLCLLGHLFNDSVRQGKKLSIEELGRGAESLVSRETTVRELTHCF